MDYRWSQGGYKKLKYQVEKKSYNPCRLYLHSNLLSALFKWPFLVVSSTANMLLCCCLLAMLFSKHKLLQEVLGLGQTTSSCRYHKLLIILVGDTLSTKIDSTNPLLQSWTDHLVCQIFNTDKYCHKWKLLTVQRVTVEFQAVLFSKPVDFKGLRSLWLCLGLINDVLQPKAPCVYLLGIFKKTWYSSVQMFIFHKANYMWGPAYANECISHVESAWLYLFVDAFVWWTSCLKQCVKKSFLDFQKQNTDL